MNNHSIARGLLASSAVLTFAALHLACTDASVLPAVTVTDSAGVTIVRSAVPSWSVGTAPWVISAEPRLEIPGHLPSGDFLYRVRAALRLPNQRMVIGNGGTRQLFFFDSDGRLEGIASREGDGPGELRGIGAVFLCGLDTLMVDEYNRVSYFDSHGLFLRTQLVTGRLIAEGANVVGVSSDCSALSLQTRHYRSPEPDESVFTLFDTLMWVAIPDGHRDTVLNFPGLEVHTTSLGGQAFSTRLPFGQEAVTAVHRDRSYIGDGGSFEVRVFGRDGRLDRVFRWAGTHLPVSDELVESLLEDRLEIRQELPDQMSLYPLPDDIPLPEYLPTYSRFLIDEANNLWVERYRSVYHSQTRTTQQHWSIFDSTGVWLGEIDTPPGLNVLSVYNGEVLGVMRDADDVESVVAFAVLRPSN